MIALSLVFLLLIFVVEVDIDGGGAVCSMVPNVRLRRSITVRYKTMEGCMLSRAVLLLWLLLLLLTVSSLSGYGIV